MAGFITTTVAPQSSLVAQTQQATTARAAAQGAHLSPAQQQNTVAQAAAVVHVSANTKKRGVNSGTGENRALDGAFEKEESKKLGEEEKKEEKGEKKETGGVVNVEA